MSAPMLHVRGQVLVGPDEVRRRALGRRRPGHLRPAAAGARRRRRSTAGCCPAWSTPTATSGSTRTAPWTGRPPSSRRCATATAGTLLIRDAGSPADTRWVDDREDLPRIIRAGRHLARTRRYIRNFAHEIEPEDLVGRTSRQEARRGDGWVKLVGDWIDRDTGDLAPCWPREALVAAVAAAHAEGARVTAHCFGEESLPDFAAAGTDCIEHAHRPAAPTPSTRSRRRASPSSRRWSTSPPSRASPGAAEAKFPAYAAHMRDLHARRYETVAAAHDAGVPIYVGTDAGGSLPHGLVAAEAAELVKAGLSVAEVLDAATWGARRWLRRPGLVEGESADLVVYQDDPRKDIAVLAAPSHVVLRGRVAC